VKRIIIAAAACAALSACAGQASESTVATVDLVRIQANWPKFINYSNQLASDTDAINRSAADARSKSQQLELLRKQYVNMQNEVSGDVRAAAESIANDRHYKLIVTRQFVGYGGVDITADVEKILKITEKPQAKS
jgi:Skp family chaperone for outer membrane proteins